MTKEKIMKSFLSSLLLIFLFSVLLTLSYFGASLEFLSEAALSVLVIASTICIGVAMFLLVFGFLLPVVAQYAYRNVFREKTKANLSQIHLWRYVLNIEKQVNEEAMRGE